jgi:general stress protein 26
LRFFIEQHGTNMLEFATVIVQTQGFAMDALKSKIREVFKRPQLTVLATVAADGTPRARYVMGVMDDEFTIRIATAIHTRKVEQIARNPQVHLTAGVADLPSAKRWVQVSGSAELTTDPAVKSSFWNDKLRAYFKGPDDPNYGVLEIHPHRIEYCTMTNLQPEILELD